MSRLTIMGAVMLCLSACSSVLAPSTEAQTGKKTTLTFQGLDGWVYAPAKPNAARDWVWIMPTHSWDNTATADTDAYQQAFLAAGFHVVSIGTGFTCGSPKGEAVYDAFYRYVVDTYKLNSKARLLGQSQGGLEAYNFAIRFPDRVNRIGGIFPVTNLRVWPGLTGIPRIALDQRMGYTEDEYGRLDDFNPADHLAQIAAGRYPVFHIHGLLDTLDNNGVGYRENTVEFMDRLNAAGGVGSYLLIPNWGHSSTGTFRQPMADFLTARMP